MTRMATRLRSSSSLVALAGVRLATLPAAAPGAVVTVRNPLDLARPSETIVLTAPPSGRRCRWRTSGRCT